MDAAQGLLLAVEDEVCCTEFSSAGIVLPVWDYTHTTGAFGWALVAVLQICTGRGLIHSSHPFTVSVHGWHTIFAVCHAVRYAGGYERADEQQMERMMRYILRQKYER